ncbi:hypothetical protein [Xenorhabdus bovienii]|nr:hypothetical protein [Xenorhabdus bovienii]MDE9590368.1 hypothetical protein [Xenorhabdus bovienii]
MYRNLALPCRLREFYFRHSEEVILAGDKITGSHIQMVAFVSGGVNASAM